MVAKRSAIANSNDVDQVEKYRILRAMVRGIPYAAGSPLLRVVLGSPLARKVLAGPMSTLRRIHGEIGRHPLDSAALARFMAVNYTTFWRVHALMVASTRTFNRYVKVENREHLDRFYGNRGIVLCNSHFGAGKAVNVILARCGFDIVSLDRVDIFTQRHHKDGIGRITSIELGKKGGTFHLKQLFQCKKALESKAILHIAADGFRGGSGIEHDFLGRKREFRRSFAELAVMTSSVVIPVFGNLNPDGTIVLTLCDPLDPETFEGDRAERVSALCDAYIALLEHYWRESPESIFKNDLNIFASL